MKKKQPDPQDLILRLADFTAAGQVLVPMLEKIDEHAAAMFVQFATEDATKVLRRLSPPVRRKRISSTRIVSRASGCHKEPCIDCGKPVSVKNGERHAFINCLDCEVRYRG
jgi:hypothetical protein